ncbi:MAG TPA: type II toxin-antitoxin system PemK/MazF family toxin [Candidatus Binatia bacterium]|jgi:mRNA interferase MazF|nr:type II toxin-antitoxin system PemK/MazF family toxin [Candidatus Binatia bacterium]
MKGLTPRRGEVWLVNFNPGRGSEQKGIRPALIIQNDTGNTYASTTIVAAITTTIREFPVTVAMPAGQGGLRQKSMVNLAQLLTIDKKRLQKRLGNLSDSAIEQVDEAIRVSLDV